MESRNNIPGLALLALSFTGCAGGDPAPDPIIGDWRAIQVDGAKQPSTESYGGEPFLRGTQLRIGDDLAGELALYRTADYDGIDYDGERVADLVVVASGAPKYRIEVGHDFFDGDGDESSPAEPITGYADTEYGDTEDPGGADDGALAEDDDLAGVRPLKLPGAPALAPAATVFACDLAGDTLTCDREGADDKKHWVFARIRPEDEV
ncbi:hypothetical protein [Nannocystis bainbridge]|uniref:Lipoprotein n=1 Tax=Nannocystis bainbridge TaxID=2995303 RepID=A0ABT5DZT0_9BACT|nr:hypothetical protein [Nannocystis bainbridge]MDC0717961.1 hypothetical protein [Nannocystis bainbridge]